MIIIISLIMTIIISISIIAIILIIISSSSSIGIIIIIIIISSGIIISRRKVLRGEHARLWENPEARRGYVQRSPNKCPEVLQTSYCTYSLFTLCSTNWLGRGQRYEGHSSGYVGGMRRYVLSRGACPGMFGGSPHQPTTTRRCGRDLESFMSQDVK